MYSGGLPGSGSALTGGVATGAAGAAVLPYTGAAVLVVAAVGIALLGAGMVLLAAVKRRQLR